MTERIWKKIIGWQIGDFVKVLERIRIISGKARKIYWYGIISGYSTILKTYQVDVKLSNGFKVKGVLSLPSVKEGHLETWHPRNPEKWKLK